MTVEEKTQIYNQSINGGGFSYYCIKYMIPSNVLTF